MTKFTRRKMNHARAHAHVTDHAHHHAQNGGIPIFAGAQGCVFKPSLKCKNQRRNYNDGNISKLGQKEGAEAEMREYDKIKQYLRQIKNYKQYFSVQAALCEPDPLEPHDLVNFDDICTNLQRVNITATNVNANLSQLRMINMPDLGIDLKKWMEQTSFNATNLRQLNDCISQLLIHAVVPMNQLGVIHNDLKSENVMIDRNNNSRIIDWGLAGITTPTQVIPVHHFMNNPVTFNRPFSTMVISTDALELYSSVVLKSTTAASTITVEQIKHFTRAMYKEYIDAFDTAGYKYLQYIFKSMFGSNDDEMLMDTVATYNAEILYHFTDRTGLKFRLDEYFSKVYRYNTDVWGLMSVFYSIFMMPRKSFIMSDAAHADMLRRYRTLFRTVVFANGHERMNVSHIVQQLRQISDAVSSARHRTQKKRTVRVRFNLSMNPKPQANPNVIKRVATPFYDRIIPKK